MKGYRKLFAFVVGILVFVLISMTHQVTDYLNLALGISLFVALFTIPNIAEHIGTWFKR